MATRSHILDTLKIINNGFMNIKSGIVLLFLLTILSGCGSDKHRYQGYVEGENIYISSSYSGILKKVFVQRGQRVKKGDLLFKLDDNPQTDGIKQIEGLLMQARELHADLKAPLRPVEIAGIVAQIGQANAQLKLANLRVTRYKELYAKHAIDKDSVDAATEKYEQAGYIKAQYEAKLEKGRSGSRVNQIKAQAGVISNLISKLKARQWELAQKSFYAPADGIIFDTYYQLGEFVLPDKPVAALLTNTGIQIEFFAPVDALATLNLGQTIRFEGDGYKTSHEAVIRYISPEAEYMPPLVYSRENNDKLVFRVKAQIKGNPTAFKPGQPVIVTGPSYE